MSILVVRLVPEGLLFAADRNITQTLRTPMGYALRGQTQRSKLLKWPNRDAIMGYVGEARIDGVPTDEWLYSFIGRNINFPDFATLGPALGQELDALMQAEKVGTPLIIHLGGFEVDAGEWTPRIWFVHNTSGLDASGPLPGTHFVWSDEVPQPHYFPNMTGNQIRADPRVQGQDGNLFSFRQGADLAAFNAIDAGLRIAMLAIIQQHPLKLHEFPTDLDEWSKHLRMAVLGYSAYFGAFYSSFDQVVGGGADVVSVSWPDDPTDVRGGGTGHTGLRDFVRRVCLLWRRAFGGERGGFRSFRIAGTAGRRAPSPGDPAQVMAGPAMTATA